MSDKNISYHIAFWKQNSRINTSTLPPPALIRLSKILRDKIEKRSSSLGQKDMENITSFIDFGVGEANW